MRRSTSNVAPTPESWHTGWEWEFFPNNYGANNSNDWTRDTSRGAPGPGRPFEERAITGPFGLAGFPAEPPHRPVRIIVVTGHDVVREVNPPRPRQFVGESPPRLMNQWNMTIPEQEEESRLTQEEQKKALKKLKKEIYNPVPKRITKRLNLYYRDNAINTSSFNIEKEKNQDEDGKRCAICLDDFEPRQEVILTPCNHMFHEDCIVPWIKSHGLCPVCRFALCERMKETALPLNNNNIANVAASDLFADDRIRFIRAFNGLRL